MLWKLGSFHPLGLAAVDDDVEQRRIKAASVKRVELHLFFFCLRCSLRTESEMIDRCRRSCVGYLYLGMEQKSAALGLLYDYILRFLGARKGILMLIRRSDPIDRFMQGYLNIRHSFSKCWDFQYRNRDNRYTNDFQNKIWSLNKIHWTLSYPIFVLEYQQSRKTIFFFPFFALPFYRKII